MLLIQELCDRNTQKKIQLMEYLRGHQFWQSTIEICKATNINTVTLTKYIKEISDELDRDSSDISIRYNFKKEMVLMYSDPSEYRKYRRKIIQDNWSIKLLLQLLLGKKISVIKFVESNFISDASYRRSISKFKKEFRKYNIEINSYKGFHVLEGEETTIRLLATKIFWSLYRGENWPFKEIDEIKLKKNMNEYFNEGSKVSLNHVNEQQFLYSIAITRIRYGNGHKISIPKSLSEEKKIAFKLLHVDNKEDELPIAEYEFIYLQLFSYVRYINTEMGKEAIKQLQISNTLVHRISQDFITQFEITFSQLTTEEKEEIIGAIYSIHFSLLLYPYYIGYEEETKSYFDRYSLLKKNMDKIVDYLSVSYKLDINKLYIKKYMMVYGQIRAMSSCEKEINILLNTDLGVLYEKIMSHRLFSILSPEFNVKIRTSFSQEVHHDFTITTSKVQEINTFFNDENIIFINEFPTEQDYINIYLLLKSI